MKVKLLTGLAGDSWSAAPGEVVEIEDAEALRHIEAGHAEAVEEAEAPARKSKAKD